MKKVFTLTVLSLLSSSIVFGQNKLVKSIKLYADSTTSVNKQTISGSTRVVQTSQAPSIDSTNWHYVVMTKSSNNTGSIYIDGLLAQDIIYTNEPYSWNTMYLGANYYTSFTQFFKGYMDELRVSNKVRSATEIQNYYNSNVQSTVDVNTIGLYHFNETSGTTFANSVSGSGTLNGAQFTTGKFSNGLYFNGVNNYGNCNLSLPTNNFTIELWVKLDGHQTSSMVNPYGAYNINFALTYTPAVKPSYSWSTGATGNSVTIDPSKLNTVWVTDGTKTDTINLGKCVTNISVTDTLKISAISGINKLPDNFGVVKVFPNPTKDILNISVTNPTANYTFQITNNIGSVVYSGNLSNSTTQINLSTLGSKGLYFIKILDTTNNVLDTRKLILE